MRFGDLLEKCATRVTCVLLVLAWWCAPVLALMAVISLSGMDGGILPDWFPFLLVVVPVERIARYLLSGVVCRVCDESLFPFSWWGEGWKVRPLFGSPVVRVVYENALSGKLQCMSCGHVDGDRNVTVRFDS